MAERIGLWLARWALRLSGNRDLANMCSILPLIRERRFAIAPEALDLHPASPLLSQNQWLLWRGQSRDELLDLHG